MRSRKSLTKNCLEHRYLLARMIENCDLDPIATWTLSGLAQWVSQDTSGRAPTFAPLLLAVVEKDQDTLPPVLRDAGLRFLAMLKWIPVDPVWGTDAIIEVLETLVQCFGGLARVAWLREQLGVQGTVWFPPDGWASAKALGIYVSRYWRREDRREPWREDGF